MNANKDYKTAVTDLNSCVIDARKLSKDLSTFCNKNGTTITDFMDARNLPRTAIVKSLRVYYQFDKGISQKDYTKMYSNREIPKSFTNDNYIGRLKIYILNEICKGIKKNPSEYIIDTNDIKEVEEIRKEDIIKDVDPVDVISKAVSPILSELRIMNTYLERLMVSLDI